MDLQWYPGHMTKAKRMMQEDIKLIDLVIELLDARAPLSSRNPDIDGLAQGKARLILLNKADLADDAVTERWKKYFAEKGVNVCKIDALDAKSMKQIEPAVMKACEKKIVRDRARGIRQRPVRAMVAGIPNVGKSTFINSYAGKAAAKTGNKPGVTKGKQWIRIGKSVELLDTPGILWPKFEDQSVGLKLALLGSIKDEIMNTEELALELIKMMDDRYPGVIEEHYGLAEAGEDAVQVPEGMLIGEQAAQAQVLIKIAKVRGCIKAKGEPDTLKAANMLNENFRNGKIGRFSLEAPEEI